MNLLLTFSELLGLHTIRLFLLHHLHYSRDERSQWLSSLEMSLRKVLWHVSCQKWQYKPLEGELRQAEAGVSLRQAEVTTASWNLKRKETEENRQLLLMIKFMYSTLKVNP